MQGVVKFWDEERFFGFITPDDSSSPEIFFHGRAVVTEQLPVPGDVVEYEIGQGRSGRTAAVNVRVKGE